MGTLHEFPFSQEFIIYVPFGASKDDEFEAITIPDDSLSRGTIYKGDVVCIQIGLIEPGGLHAVSTSKGKYVGFLVYQDDLVTIGCNDDEYEPDTFRRDEIQAIGRVVQVYPNNDVTRYWELRSTPQFVKPKRRRKTAARAMW